MTDKERLIELAERCEAATADEQRGLLQETYEVIYGRWPRPNRGGDNAENRFCAMLRCRAHESAALTLVPEGCSWRAGLANYGGFARIDAIELSEDYQRAATPALALTAAAIRARASEAE